MVDVSVVHVPERLQEGMILVDRGQLDQAKKLFVNYMEANPDSALALSFVGMLRSVVDGRVDDGVDLCQKALRKDSRESLCYLNLAKAYLTRGDRYACIRTLHRGLKVRSPHREYLLVFHKTIGVRRQPIIRFLSRNNPINNLLGRLTWAMKKGPPDRVRRLGEP